MNFPKDRIPYLATVTFCSLALCVFLGLWVRMLIVEFRLARLREDLITSIDQGEARQVLTVIAQLAPDGTGTGADWLGDESYRGQPGFSWLVSTWRDHGNTRGSDALFSRWHEVDPAFPRQELLTHLEWLKNAPDERFEELFLFALSIDFGSSVAEGSEARHPLRSVLGDDPSLALRAIELIHKDPSLFDLRGEFIDLASHESNLADPVRFERLIEATDLLDPASEFDLIPSPDGHDESVGKTWIEFLHSKISPTSLTKYQPARDRLETVLTAELSPETPGIFFLGAVFETSPSVGLQQISPGRASELLPFLEDLPQKTKPEFAALLNRLIPDFQNEKSLREWVWTHHHPSWNDQNDRFLSLRTIQDKAILQSSAISDWLNSSAKFGQTSLAAPAFIHLWRLDYGMRSSADGGAWALSSNNNHPFTWAPAQFRVGTKMAGAPFSAERFLLLTSLGSIPESPPSEWFPKAEKMRFRSVSEKEFSTPWENASAEEFIEMLNTLGEPLADSPSRFLIVPCFLDLGDNFSRSLPRPDELARFQVLARKDSRPGAWLAKDLADLLPWWWINSEKERNELLASGGSGHSLERMFDYLDDSTVPVSPRVSYALAAIDWSWPSLTRSTFEPAGSPHPKFPEMDRLALEFASEFADGRWEFSMISKDAWSRIIEGWLSEATEDPSREAAQRRSEARQKILNRLEPAVREILGPRNTTTGKKPAIPTQSIPLLAAYSRLLKEESRSETLLELLTEVEGRIRYLNEVFPWIPSEQTNHERLRSLIVHPIYQLRIARYGVEKAAEEIANEQGPSIYSVFSDASGGMGLREWINHCKMCLDYARNDKSGTSAGREGFFAMPPLKAFRTPEKNSFPGKVAYFKRELSDLIIEEENAPFFALALPPVILQYFGSGIREPARFKEFENAVGADFDPVIHRAILTALDRSGRAHRPEVLANLKNPAIPLAQRWVASNYFLIRLSEDRPYVNLRAEELPPEDTQLFETAVDLLIAMARGRFQPWDTSHRGLGTISFRPTHRFLSLSYFLNLCRLDKGSQLPRATSLLERSMIETLLKEPQRIPALECLHDLALLYQAHEVSLDLFAEAEKNLSLSSKIQWLLKAENHLILARVFEREWENIPLLPVGFSDHPDEESLKKIISHLPDDPDLRMLVSTTLARRSTTIFLLNRWSGRESFAGSPLAEAFLSHTFRNKKMESICLGCLPGNALRNPEISDWLDCQVGRTDLRDLPAVARSKAWEDWPYWRSRIEILAGNGEFEALGTMFPDKAWFGSRSQDNSYMMDTRFGTVQEMVWMGFARSVGEVLLHGSPEDRRDASAFAAGLLASLPIVGGSWPNPLTVSSETGMYFNSSHLRPSAVPELASLATCAELLATLSDPEESVTERCLKFTYGKVPAITGSDRTLPGIVPSEFFRMLADFAAQLTEAQRLEVFLRAVELPLFSPGYRIREMPCRSLAVGQLPPGISGEFVVKMARTRLEERPDHAFRKADLGLVLTRMGGENEAESLLVDALVHLQRDRKEDAIVHQVVTQALGDLRRSSGASGPARP